MTVTRKESNFEWSWFDINWSWIGLYATIAFAALLFGTNKLRSQSTVSRWRDPAWLAWLVVPLYAIHQFEEYGIDLTGVKHAFPNKLCQGLGKGEYPACPVPPAFFLAVNIGAIWIVAPLTALLFRQNPRVGLSLYGIISTNTLTHLLGAIKLGYNPGLATAVVLFLPLSCWLAYISPELAGVGLTGVVMNFVNGLICHVILIGSLGLFNYGHLSKELLILINFTNTTTPILLNWIEQRYWKKTKISKRD